MKLFYDYSADEMRTVSFALSETLLQQAQILVNSFSPLALASSRPQHYKTVARLVAANRLAQANLIMLQSADECFVDCIKADERVVLHGIVLKMACRLHACAVDLLKLDDQVATPLNSTRNLAFEYRYSRRQISSAGREAVSRTACFSDSRKLSPQAQSLLRVLLDRVLSVPRKPMMAPV